MSALMDSAWPAILLMGLVTYLIRVGGYWLMGHVRLTRRLRAALEALPGGIFVSTALPLAIAAGAPGIAGAAASAGAMFFSRRELISLLAGFATAAALRWAGF